MKTKIIFLLACMLMMIPGIANAAIAVEPSPPCECDDNLCTNCGEIRPLFTICDKRNRNCTEINTDTINNNQKYDLFEIKDKEIYLDNSEINLEFNRIWSLLDYKMHISGTNKITYLNSFNTGKNSISVQMYPNLYTSYYIPFTVEGDGTLEIEVANQIKKNTAGETYYKCWTIDRKVCSSEEVPSMSRTNNVANINKSDYKLLDGPAPAVIRQVCLTEATINTSDNTATFSVPASGYTVSDLKSKFAENADVFYLAELNSTVELTSVEFPRLLKSYAKADNVLTADGRRQFIDTLINNKTLDDEGRLGCEMSYFIPTEIVTEEAQITSAWGEANIQTSLSRSFSKTGSYLINFPEEKTMITTTKTDNIVFESTEEFDPNYHLVVDDITEKITDVQSLSVQAKTDKTLVELYDIYMADENDNIVKMENGTYKIKIELNDLLKKYENYQIIYISDDNKVELIDATVEGNYITFNTTHLSKYGVVGKEIRKTGNIITNPQTADSVVTYALVLAALAVVVALVVLRIKKLKKANMQLGNLLSLYDSIYDTGTGYFIITLISLFVNFGIISCE